MTHFMFHISPYKIQVLFSKLPIFLYQIRLLKGPQFLSILLDEKLISVLTCWLDRFIDWLI